MFGDKGVYILCLVLILSRVCLFACLGSHEPPPPRLRVVVGMILLLLILIFWEFGLDWVEFGSDLDNFGLAEEIKARFGIDFGFGLFGFDLGLLLEY